MSQPRSSGYFRTSYAGDIVLVDTRAQWAGLAVLVAGLAVMPFAASPFLLDLANQVLLASIGAVALMLLTGYVIIDIRFHLRFWKICDEFARLNTQREAFVDC